MIFFLKIVEVVDLGILDIGYEVKENMFKREVEVFVLNSGGESLYLRGLV